MSTNHNSSFAKAEMLIRKPVAEVFKAFIDPGITTHFWFTKSNGKLVAGTEVNWTWEMYDHTEKVSVKAVDSNKRILIEWGGDEDSSTVEWIFTPVPPNSTFVSITNSGFKGDLEKIVSQVRDSTEGFTLVLAGLKAYFEHGIELNLVADRFPAGIQK